MRYPDARLSAALVATVLMLTPACSNGPRIEGRVVHAFSKEGLKGVAVSVEEADRGAKTDGRGRFSLGLPKDFAGEITLALDGKGMMSRKLHLRVPAKGGVSIGTLSLVPPPGLYVRGESAPMTTFAFERLEMAGLTIPAYYDGTYSVMGDPATVSIAPVEPLYWVPRHTATLGENVFAASTQLHCFRLEDSQVFVRYQGGRGSGNRVRLGLAALVDTITTGSLELVQQKVQAFRLTGRIPPGRYVLFQGGGNSMDNQSHPDAELGCWNLRVVDPTQTEVGATATGTADRKQDGTWTPATVLVFEDATLGAGLQDVLAGLVPPERSILALFEDPSRILLVIAEADVPVRDLLLKLPRTTQLLADYGAGLVRGWAAPPPEGQYTEFKVTNLDLSDADRVRGVERRLSSDSRVVRVITVDASQHPESVTLGVFSDKPISEVQLDQVFGTAELRYLFRYRLVRRNGS